VKYACLKFIHSYHHICVSFYIQQGSVLQPKNHVLNIERLPSSQVIFQIEGAQLAERVMAPILAWRSLSLSPAFYFCTAPFSKRAIFSRSAVLFRQYFMLELSK
jgi:hypothetical protein